MLDHAFDIVSEGILMLTLPPILEKLLILFNSVLWVLAAFG